MHYVLGFAFLGPRRDSGNVLLIEKKRGPASVIGKLNGIGGKVNVGEGARSAMARRFHKETSIETDAMEWYSFHTMRFRNGNIVTCLVTALNSTRFYQYDTCTDEKVQAWSAGAAASNALSAISPDRRRSQSTSKYQVASDLSYLLPMALEYLKLPIEDRDIGY